MRSLTALFDIEKNKKIGAKPVWILKCPFVAGTLYLSDRVFTYTGITIKPWIAAWGSIDEDLSDQLTMPMVSDFSLDIIIDPDEATNIHDLLWFEAVETLKFELYLWFEGLTVATDPMLKVWTGNIIDFERINELVYNVRLVDEGVRIDKNPGNVLSLADYPNASLDDVGYQLPILYGAIEKSPALRLDVGKKTTLIAAIDGDDVDFYLSDGSGFANGTNIVIDTEEIQITTISGNHITACVRAYNSTAAANHNAGTLVLENQAVCVFMFADHPVKSIGNIYARRPLDGVSVDVTSICTKYTGQGGANDYAGYAGKAVITCPGYITFEQAADLGLIDTIDFDAYTNDEAVETRWGIGAPTYVNQNTPFSASVNNPSGMSTAASQEQWIEVSFSVDVVTPPPTGTVYLYIMLYSTTLTLLGTINSTGYHPRYGSPLIVPVTINELTHFGMVSYWVRLRCIGVGGTTWTMSLDSVKYCSRRPIAVTMTKAGTVTLTGEGAASVAVGDNILISGEGYQDDGSGTYTGTASSLISRPDHIFKHFLYTCVSWPVADFSTDAAASFAADSYAFSVVINTRKSMKEWLAYMALQCRCWFRFAGGKAYLLYRPDSITSDKIITAAMTLMDSDNATSLKVVRSPLDEIMNVVNLYYQRDWTKDAGREAYQAVTKATDATSIAAYGEKEKADTFLFDFVRNATMATDLRDFYLARYKDRKKVVTAKVFLDNMELEFADGVTFTALSSLLCEVRMVGYSPGAADRNDNILLTAREY